MLPERWRGMTSSFCKCLLSFWLAQCRWIGTVSGYHCRVAVTDVHGAEVKSAPQGNVRVCCPCAGLLIPAFDPSLQTYSRVSGHSVLTGWAKMLIVGASGAIEL